MILNFFNFIDYIVVSLSQVMTHDWFGFALCVSIISNLAITVNSYGSVSKYLKDFFIGEFSGKYSRLYNILLILSCVSGCYLIYTLTGYDGFLVLCSCAAIIYSLKITHSSAYKLINKCFSDCDNSRIRILNLIIVDTVYILFCISITLYTLRTVITLIRGFNIFGMVSSLL